MVARLLRRLFYLGVLLPLLAVRPTYGQVTRADLSARLQGKPLFLRGMWGEQDLQFDCAGAPSKNYPKLSFTEGGIDIREVKLSPGVLRLRGDRIGLVYDSGPVPRRVKMFWPQSGSVTLRILCAPGGDYGPALDAIFATELTSLVPSPSRYWALVGNYYLAHAGGVALQGAELAQDLALPDPAFHAGKATMPDSKTPKNIKPPKLLSGTASAYSEAARSAHYDGTVLIYLWVLPSGKPAHLRVVKPAGLGMDEAALATAAQYRFVPAEEDGVPVKYDLFVEVSFS